MAIEKVGASFREQWDQINWLHCQSQTRRLQARIVQAVKERRWNKVKALQRLLTRSFSAKALAVRRVTTNKGKHTPGIDGLVWQTSKSRILGIKSLREKGYKPKPLRRIYIPKLDGSKRPLGIPTIKDRAMQALYLMGVEPIAETLGDNHSYGFRAYRSAADAVSQIFLSLSTRRSPQWILEGDITKCFDQIDHNWLMRSIPMEKRVLQKWLKSGFIDKKKLFPTQTGTPQGGIISPVLANMTLDGLEEAIAKQFGTKGSIKRKKNGVHIIRYADDFVVTGRTKEILETKVKPLIEEFLKDRGLTLSEKKTIITHISKGFDFLGQTIRKYKNKLIIKPSKKSIDRLLKRVREMIHKNQAETQEKIIKMLSPQIRGWAYYHRRICARKAYEKIDHQVFQAVWKWAKRRHPNKSLQWIKRKYFKSIGLRNWRFGTYINREGEKIWKELFQASSIPIRRHIKIRGEANPFDKDWYDYFTKRLKKKPSCCIG
jgi:RNA-directed DNA polymerase